MLSWYSMVVSVCSRCDRPQPSMLVFLTPYGLSSTFKYPDQQFMHTIPLKDVSIIDLRILTGQTYTY